MGTKSKPKQPAAAITTAASQSTPTKPAKLKPEPTASAKPPKPKREPKPKPEPTASVPTPSVEIAPSACPACGSTARTGYHHATVQDIEGVHHGRPYKFVQWNRCECRDCGQARVDIVYHNRKRRPADGLVP